ESGFPVVELPPLEREFYRGTYGIALLMNWRHLATKSKISDVLEFSGYLN
ncbi:unnamed protein product, partial [Larinioides sclopetarius]